MKRFLLVVLVAAAGFFAWAMVRKDDPVTTAKLKCEFAVERLTGYDIGIMEVAAAHVTGDIFNGTVQMSFDVSGRNRLAVCIYESGKIRSVTLDGQLLAGQR